MVTCQCSTVRVHQRVQREKLEYVSMLKKTQFSNPCKFFSPTSFRKRNIHKILITKDALENTFNKSIKLIKKIIQPH